MHSVITTINHPTEAVKEVAKRSNLIVVFDKKTPKDFDCSASLFIEAEDKGEFSVVKFLPFNHYSRKNLGYLFAIKMGASCIYDTDDDNIPNENWKQRQDKVYAEFSKSKGWFNVYNLLSTLDVWPRGFSLTHLDNIPEVGHRKDFFNSSIQQGLSAGEPDVDAIWRLTNNAANKFDLNASIFIKPFSWCPFNSQSTWWFPKAYPLMYLPVTASFRMTDIWRSFVAQRCLWELGEGITFHSPAEVTQIRNPHDLLKDFKDEIPGYLNNDKIVEILTHLELKPGLENVCDNMRTCYRALVDEGIMVMHELRSLHCWINDINKIWKP